MPINAQMDQVHRQESAVKKRKTILLPITRWGDGISLVAKTSKTSDEGEVMKFSVGAGGWTWAQHGLSRVGWGSFIHTWVGLWKTNP